MSIQVQREDAARDTETISSTLAPVNDDDEDIFEVVHQLLDDDIIIPSLPYAEFMDDDEIEEASIFEVRLLECC